MIIWTKYVAKFNAAAITVFPFILMHPETAKDPLYYEALLTHENVHMAQQKRWAIWGLGLGLILYFLLYLLVLPKGWNYFRRKWETEAFLASGHSLETIEDILTQAPYYLRRKTKGK